ncbi:hypothetical protein BOX15_Mlig016445g5, partial [Macrostomum lignano]
AAGEDTPGLETTDSEAPRQRKPVHRLIDMEPTQKKRKKNKYVSSDDESSKSKSDSETESETDMLQQEDVGDIGSLFSLHGCSASASSHRQDDETSAASVASSNPSTAGQSASAYNSVQRQKQASAASFASSNHSAVGQSASACNSVQRQKQASAASASVASSNHSAAGRSASAYNSVQRQKQASAASASVASSNHSAAGRSASAYNSVQRQKQASAASASVASSNHSAAGRSASACSSVQRQETAASMNFSGRSVPATPVQSAAGCSLEYTSDDDDTIGPGPLDSHLTPSPSRRADNAAPLGTSFLSQFCAEENFRYTGDDETTLMRLVCSTFSLAKENNQLLKQLAASRQMPQLAKLNLPFVLPVSTKDELDQLEQYLRIPKQSTMLASYIGCMVSDSQRKAVFMLMPKFITTQLAASFNYEGKRGGKAAFKDFANTISLVRRLVAQGSKSGKCESNIVKTAIADWLRQAPARLKAT